MNIDGIREMNRVKDDSREKMERACLVSGFRLAFIRIGVALTVLWISFKINQNPLKAVSLLRSLIKERLNIHENAGQYKAVKSGVRYFWSVNLPGWPSETFNHFIFNEFQRINSPDNSTLQTIIFAITNICPLHCIHCYEWDNISDKNRLSIKDLKYVMEKIRNYGIRHIQFSGGEPLSRFDDMIELMKYSGNTNDFWINTSGFGLTKGKARIMKQNGMIGAIISLDDWDETRHNMFRNNSKSFYWVKEATRNCNEAGIIVCLSICPVKEFVTEENLNRFYKLAKNLGAGFIRIIEPRRVGRFAGENVMLDASHIDILDRFMISHNSDPAYNEYPIIQFPGHHQRKSGCLGTGNRYIYIDSNGEFHACPFCRKPLGNVLKDSINSGIVKARAYGCHVFKQRTLI
jgi:MoaA/NifB/PqqE/SkfB family radical SAM enzyme